MRIQPTVRKLNIKRHIYDELKSPWLFHKHQSNPKYFNWRSFRFLWAISLFLPGCSLFFGNVKPVEEKSDHYSYLDLAQPFAGKNSGWIRLDPLENENTESSHSEGSDVAFQSEETASVVSINTACRQYGSENTQKNLRVLTQELMVGFSEVKILEEKELKIQGVPALRSVIQGQLAGEKMMLETLVLQKEKCVYDIMYISRPQFFKKNLTDFTRFVSGLKIR